MNSSKSDKHISNAALNQLDTVRGSLTQVISLEDIMSNTKLIEEIEKYLREGFL